MGLHTTSQCSCWCPQGWMQHSLPSLWNRNHACFKGGTRAKLQGSSGSTWMCSIVCRLCGGQRGSGVAATPECSPASAPIASSISSDPVPYFFSLQLHSDYSRQMFVDVNLVLDQPHCSFRLLSRPSLVHGVHKDVIWVLIVVANIVKRCQDLLLDFRPKCSISSEFLQLQSYFIVVPFAK